MMNKKFDGAAAPKRYESPALAVLNVNLENGYASGNVDTLNPKPLSFDDPYGYYDELY